jgi:RNA polymerase sigma-70 factor (ECF subfamily)
MHTMIEAHVTIELCLRRRGRRALSQSPASLVECTVDAFEHRSDQELLERTAHEPEAFGAFYRRHVAAVLVFFRRRTGDPQLALGVRTRQAPADTASHLANVDLDEALSADQAGAVRARVLEGQSYERIAEQLRCSPQVARQLRLARAAQPQTTLGEASMTTGDPIRDLERQLVGAAARETAPQTTTPRRVARRWASTSHRARSSR